MTLSQRNFNDVVCFIWVAFSKPLKEILKKKKKKKERKPDIRHFFFCHITFQLEATAEYSPLVFQEDCPLTQTTTLTLTSLNKT